MTCCACAPTPNHTIPAPHSPQRNGFTPCPITPLADPQEALAAEAWRAALSRAAGEKVYDDPKLLRRSIKREQQEKVRSAKKWQERVSSQQEQQRARQEK